MTTDDGLGGPNGEGGNGEEGDGAPGEQDGAEADEADALPGPKLTLPLPPTILEDTPITFTDISISGPSSVTMTIVAQSTFKLASIAQISFVEIDGVPVTPGTVVFSDQEFHSAIFTGPTAAVRAALNGMRYTPTLNDDDGGGISFTATGNGKTVSESLVINIIPVNDNPETNNSPEATAGATLEYTENDPASVLDGTITVNDVDNPVIDEARVQITGNYVQGEDVLAYTYQVQIGGEDTSAITASFDPVNGMLSFSGAATLAAYQAALRSVTYRNTSEDPSAAQRTVTIIVNDGEPIVEPIELDSAAVTSTINVTPVNDAPVASGGAALGLHRERPGHGNRHHHHAQRCRQHHAGLGHRADHRNYVQGEDVLGFVDTASITGSFNPATGTLSLSGTDTLANYEAALRSVTYRNPSGAPSTAQRTVTFSVNDGETEYGPALDSNTLTSTIDVFNLPLEAITDTGQLVVGASASTNLIGNDLGINPLLNFTGDIRFWSENGNLVEVDASTGVATYSALYAGPGPT